MHILRGMAKADANDEAGAIAEYRAALALDATHSLASYRLGEIYFRQRNNQAAEDAFKELRCAAMAFPNGLRCGATCS